MRERGPLGGSCLLGCVIRWGGGEHVVQVLVVLTELLSQLCLRRQRRRQRR